MGRKILAVIVAMIVAGAVIMIGQMGMAAIWTAPSPTIRQDPATMAAYIQSLPIQAFLVLAIIYAVASFAGGFIVTKMGRRFSSGMALPLILGVLLLIGGVLNFFVFVPHHPAWVTAVCLLIFLPFTILGHKVAK